MASEQAPASSPRSSARSPPAGIAGEKGGARQTEAYKAGRIRHVDSAGPYSLLSHLETPKTPHTLPFPPLSQEHKMASVRLPKGSYFSHLIFKHLFKKDALLFYQMHCLGLAM